MRACLRKSQHRGQALVESAIVIPILIFFLLGVFEVGWALRGYLVLANANREAARFAIRPRYVDYDAVTPDFTPIITHTFNSLSKQIPFENGGVIIISRIKVDTDYPCDPAEVYDAEPPICDWQAAMVNPYTPTIAITPLDVPTYTYTWPVTATQQTRLDYNALKAYLIERNFEHNANLMMQTRYSKPQVDDVIIVEMFFDQPQLMEFPILSNALTDPVPFYTHTMMRRIISRS